MEAMGAMARKKVSLASLLSLLSLSSLGLLGCSHFRASYDTAPNGLVRAEYNFRRYLEAGRADSALLQLTQPMKKSQLPGDALLRLLFEGVAAHYSGNYERSASAFDRAALTAEDRTTKSISRAAASMIVNDLSLAYEPSPTEQLMLPYFAALTYAHAGRYMDAAVEARRLSALLQSLADDDDSSDKRLHAFFRYFAGAVFDAAGEHADADVAYRNAWALDSMALPERDTLRTDSTAEIVLVVEHGFVPHRVQESLLVLLPDAETHEFEDHAEDSRRATAARIAERVINFASSSGPRSGSPRSRTLWVPAPSDAKASRSEVRCDSAGKCRDEHEDHSYLLRMSWPVMYAPATPTRTFRFVVDSTAVAAGMSADISSSVLSDFQREQPAIVARTIARAATKYLATKSAEKSAGKKHQALGDVVGAVANITAALTEQADTRSWHLLPGSLTLLRTRVPAGQHQLRLDCSAGAPIELGTVVLRPGQLVVLSKRVWE